MGLYIRALDICAPVLVIYGILIVLDFVAYWLTNRLQYSKVSFVSNMLEPDGWTITLPLSISRCYTHKVKRHPNKVPLAIMSANLLINILSFYATVILVDDKDMLCYTFINGLMLLASVLLWYSKCRETLGQTTHREYLKLIELCYCPDNPECTVLVLIDRLGYAYTYLATGTYRWKTNSCYECICYDDYIVSLDMTMDYDPDSLYYIPKNTLRSNIHWFSYTTPRLCGLLSILCSLLGMLLNSVILSAMAVTFILMIIVTFPYSRTMELSCHALRKTVIYKDLPDEYAYTFILLDKSGNPYYYLTDDKEALSINSTYKAVVKGREVTNISYEVTMIPAIDYDEPQGAAPIYGLMAIWCFGTFVLEIMNLELLGILAQIPLVITYVLMLRYRKKGEV